MTAKRVTQTSLEVLVRPIPKLRISQVTLEVLVAQPQGQPEKLLTIVIA